MSSPLFNPERVFKVLFYERDVGDYERLSSVVWALQECRAGHYVDVIACFVTSHRF